MATKAPKQKAPVPSVLAFSRKLEASDALMYSGLWSDIDQENAWQPIELHEKRNRATHSQYGADDNKKPTSNLSWGDDAVLPHTADTLRLSFTLKTLGNLDEPTACNDPEFEQKIKSSIAAYKDEFKFSELALRYAHNIANARFLWRNRVGAEEILVKVKHKSGTWQFDAYEYALNDFKATDSQDFNALVAAIQEGLNGKGFEYFEIVTYAKVGLGQRLWPSQEMVMNIPKGEKTRHLFHLYGCAAMHSEKIGNALRTIDTWYTDAENVGAIAIEPFGSVTSKAQAWRSSKNDFYSLFIRWLNKDELVTAVDQHFVIAVLIRGGVFGGNDKKSEKE